MILELNMFNGSKKVSVKRAAVIPYFVDDNGTVHMMFMAPSDSRYGGSDPQLAKGKVDPEDESIQDTAFREAHEELGLRKDNIYEDSIKFYGTILGNTDLFYCRVINQTSFDEPHYETEKVFWLTNEEFGQYGRPLHIDIVNEVSTQIMMDILQ